MDDPVKRLWATRNGVPYPISMDEVDGAIASLAAQDDDRWRWWRVSCEDIVHGWDSTWAPTAVVMVHGKASVDHIALGALHVALARAHPGWSIDVVEV